MGFLTKFAASKVSGYLLIALLVAAAGAGFWFWAELKEFGSLHERAKQQELTIQQQADALERIQEQMLAKDRALAGQQERTQILARQAEVTRQQLQEARNAASQDYLDCRDHVVPDSLRFGPSRQNRGGEDSTGR